MRPLPRLGAAGEIAKALDTSPQNVNNWVRRYADFPKPLAKLRMATIWDLDEVIRWYGSHWELPKGLRPKTELMSASEVARKLGHPVSPPNVTCWARKIPSFPKPKKFKFPGDRGPMYDFSEVYEWYHVTYPRHMAGRSGRRL